MTLSGYTAAIRPLFRGFWNVGTLRIQLLSPINNLDVGLGKLMDHTVEELERR